MQCLPVHKGSAAYVYGERDRDRGGERERERDACMHARARAHKHTHTHTYRERERDFLVSERDSPELQDSSGGLAKILQQVKATICN